jgi:hypothetical protein
MDATAQGYNVRVSKPKHCYGLNPLHYLTTSIPRGGIAPPSVGGFVCEWSWACGPAIDAKVLPLVTPAQAGVQVGGFPLSSQKKRAEKLNHTRNNLVRRGLVKQRGDWPWWSWRFYFWNDASVLAMDKMVW